MHQNPTSMNRARLPRRFPLNLFATWREPEADPFLDRLDALHHRVPDHLPEKRFFRH